jgi:predicted enzyme related to lactoylglutathione lyase
VNTFLDWIVRLGGSRIREVTDDAGYYAVMQDPEGNEFCVGAGAANRSPESRS